MNLQYENNYSKVQQWLHKLVLSSQAIRESQFDIESSLVRHKVNSNNNHVFISGMARAGTTALLNAIHSADCFASIKYSDMPFVLAPNLWSKLNFGSRASEMVERAHGDKVLVSTDSPEAFEEVFWKTFPDSTYASEQNFKKFVNHVLTKHKKSRYLSKNNQNYQRLNFIAELFPKSTILVPFRSPVSHAQSLLDQHTRFIETSKQDPFIGKYMSLIGHYEFGPNYSPAFIKDTVYKNPLEVNHWIEQWMLTYRKLALVVPVLENAHFVCYEKLCADKECWQTIQERCEININASFELRPRDYDVSVVDHNLLRQCEETYQHLEQYSI